MVISNESTQVIHKAQAASTSAPEATKITSEDDIQELVNEVRYKRDK